MRTETQNFDWAKVLAESELDNEELCKGEEVIVTENGEYFVDTTELVMWLKKIGYWKYIILGEE